MSANAFNLAKAKMLSFGKELMRLRNPWFQNRPLHT